MAYIRDPVQGPPADDLRMVDCVTEDGRTIPAGPWAGIVDGAGVTSTRRHCDGDADSESVYMRVFGGVRLAYRRMTYGIGELGGLTEVFTFPRAGGIGVEECDDVGGPVVDAWECASSNGCGKGDTDCAGDGRHRNWNVGRKHIRGL